MNKRKKVLAISGSTRLSSSNLSIIEEIKGLFSEELDVEVFESLLELPPFNPDWDNDHPPPKVIAFRNQLKEAQGILICTPEYAMGVPGTLKNALDWTVSSMEFSKKPVALITASSVGEKGHRSLLETLHIIESDLPESSQLLISFVKTKVKGGKIVDMPTLNQVKEVVTSLIKCIESIK